MPAHFLKHEDHQRGADAWHAAPGFDASGSRPGGEWRVERQRLQWDILDAFVQAAQEADIAHTDDFNRGDNEGVGYFDVNQRRGIRGNATKTPFIQCLHGERVQSEPASRGRVRMRSARAADAPSIAPHYLSTEEDRRIAADACA